MREIPLSLLTSAGGDGAEIIYSLRNNSELSNLIAMELAKAGQNVRKTYQRRLPSNPSKDYYYILRDTPNNESLIVEYGFADSKGDDVSLLKNRWKDLAESVVQALATYVGVDASKPSNGTYVVKAGDTLWSIAKQYGVSVNDLKEENQLQNNTLQVNQILKIPGFQNENETAEDTYVVKAGDTLYSISKTYGVSVDQIKRLNQLNSDVLSIGQILVLKEPSITEDEGSYIVKKGDSLYSISKQYGVSVNDLMEINNLDSTMLSIGQVLLIPSTSETIYTVKSGDTLWNIAKEFQTTVDQIMQKNNLITNILKIGQKLLIP